MKRNAYKVISYDQKIEKCYKNYKSAYKHCKDIYNVPLKDLKTMHLQRIVDNCGHGAQTKSMIKSIMTGVFEYADMNDIVDKNYANFIKFEEYETEIERNPFTNQEIKEIWKNKDDLYYKITIIYNFHNKAYKLGNDLKIVST